MKQGATLKVAARVWSHVSTWAGARIEAPGRRKDAGQGSVEYLGVIILVGLIIVAIISTGVGDDIANGLNYAVARIVGPGGLFPQIFG